MVDKIGSNSVEERAARDLGRLFFGEIPFDEAPFDEAPSDKLGKEESARLADRTGESPEYWDHFEQSAQLLADLEPLADDPELLAVVSRYSKQHKSRQGKESLPRRTWLGLAVAATLLLGLGISLWQSYWPVPEPQNILRYVTRIGEQKTINLKDGSEITLNTGTQLLVNITEDNREVILERGEVYFSVVADPNRPFTVNLDNRTVSVLGTEFNILKEPEKMVLAVVEGVVALHGREDQLSPDAPELRAKKGQPVHLPAGGQHRIEAGMVAEINEIDRALIAYAPENMERLHSWRSGVLRFDAVPLSEVIRELNRYSAKKILIEDASIMDLRVFATVKVGSPSMAMTALERLLPIRVVNHFDRTVIVGRKDEGGRQKAEG